MATIRKRLFSGEAASPDLASRALNAGDPASWTVEQCSQLLKMKALPNHFEGGRTCLHRAALASSSNVFQCLLDGKANPDLSDSQGCLAIHHAGNESAAILLLPTMSASHVLNEPCPNGQPLVRRFRYSDDVLPLLVERKADYWGVFGKAMRPNIQ